MDFLHLDLLHLSIAIAFLLVTWGLLTYSFRRARAMTPDRESDNYETARYRVGARLVSLAVVCVLLTTAWLGPIAPWDTISEREWAEIVWLLDVSKSMDVRDVTTPSGNTSRLLRAKSIIESFMTAHPENRYGLVVFAGEARVVSPITSSVDSVLTFLGSVDSGNISEWWSDFRKVLDLATERFAKSNDPITRSFVLLSDGGDPEDAPDTTIIKNIFHGKRLFLTTVGLGSEKGWPIPIGNDPFGNPVYKRYSGETVVSALNESNLRSLANTWGGQYLSDDADDADMVRALARTTKRVMKDAASDGQNDIGRWFVIVALPFFLFSLASPRKLKYSTPETRRLVQ